MSGPTSNIPPTRTSQRGVGGIFFMLAAITIQRSQMPDHGSILRRWSAIPLRLIVGYGFIAHGYAKVANGPEHFAASLNALHVPASHWMAWLTIAIELFGGFAV